MNISSRGFRKAFTLIELLVVIAIIAEAEGRRGGQDPNSTNCRPGAAGFVLMT